ncbi:MAG: spermidine/putrescine ABC transporter permease PotC [Alphaproteobacteria bacterium]|nr:spermidine/putrescine ABC transporter permease PotC [Alphaproteobacteria bacterium]
MVRKFLKFLYILTVYLVLYIPLIVAIVLSFSNSEISDTWNGFTTKWYSNLFSNSDLLQAAIRSIILATMSACLSTVVGTITAIALHRYKFIGQKVVYSSLSVIMMSPEIVQGISLVVMFIVLGVPLGFTTLLLSHTVFCFPYVTMTVLARLKGFDKQLIEAASDLGATDVDIVRKILIPLIIPAVFAGWLMSFTLSIDDVVISYFVGDKSFEILPLKIYSMVQTGIKPDVNALCAVLFFVTFFAVILSYKLLKIKK